MARFRLKGKHYLNVPGTEWEQNETNRDSGKQARKRYAVPVYLDPEDPSDHNYPGEIIVSTEKSRQNPRDLVFLGPPTPDMEPLDEEAEAIFNELRPIWELQHPIESLPGTYGEALAAKFERQVEEAARRGTPNVSVSEFEDLKKSNAELKSQLAALMAKLDERPARRA